MRLSLAIRTLFRSPIRTLLTFVLLAAAAFMLVYSAADYALTSREYNKAVKSYRGIGTVERGEPDDTAYQLFTAWPMFLVSDRCSPVNFYEVFNYNNFHQPGLLESDVSLLKSLQYISNLSMRYMTAGISPDYNRMDNNPAFFNYTARFVFEATLEEIDKNPGNEYINPLQKKCVLYIDDIILLAGENEWFKLPHYINKNGYIGISYQIISDGIDAAIYDVVSNQRVSMSCWQNLPFESQYKKLIPGQKYIFTGRLEPILYDADQIKVRFNIGDDTLYNWWDYIYSLEGIDTTKNYLELDEFKPLKELIQITNDDLRTFDMVYTDDMAAIRQFYDAKMFISQGRGINKEDSDLKNPVCVVSEAFLNTNNLKVGDKIKLSLGDKLFEQFAPLGAVASLRDRYSDKFTEAEFEIVGAYIDTNTSRRINDLFWTYSDNTIFVPLSFLNVEHQTLDEHEFKPGELSFIVGDARNIRAFTEECIPLLEKQGLTVNFTDGGWLRLEEQFNQTRVLSLSKLLAFTAATVLAGALIVYLFIGRKRREYAVMRALGTTKRKAAKTLFVPLMLIAFVAVILGSAASVTYAGQTADKTLKTFAEMGLEVNPNVPFYVVAVCIIVLLIIIALLALYGLYHMGEKAAFDAPSRKHK